MLYCLSMSHFFNKRQDLSSDGDSLQERHNNVVVCAKIRYNWSTTSLLLLLNVLLLISIF